MTEYHATMWGTDAVSDTPSTSTGNGTLQLGQSHQASHSRSVQEPTEVNLDAEMMASPSGEEHVVTSQ